MSVVHLTPQFLRLTSGEFDLATIFQLLLSKKRIRSPLDTLERCGNLRFLDLSRNEITSLDTCLFDLLLLEHLDLSHNKISRVEGLPNPSGNNLRTLRLFSRNITVNK